jgi:hypothetical protein
MTTLRRQPKKNKFKLLEEIRDKRFKNMSFLKFSPVNPSSKCPLVISRIFPWPFEPPKKHENV